MIFITHSGNFFYPYDGEVEYGILYFGRGEEFVNPWVANNLHKSIIREYYD